MMSPKPGTYALILLTRQIGEIQIGNLGRLQIKPGFYVYVGSAFGPGGLKARISHHRHISTHPRWHIDFLRRVTCLQGVWYTYDPVYREHQWAETLAQSRHASTPLGGFGSSDCRCKSHLTFYHTPPSVASFSRKIHARHSDHGKLFIDKTIGSVKSPHPDPL